GGNRGIGYAVVFLSARRSSMATRPPQKTKEIKPKTTRPKKTRPEEEDGVPFVVLDAIERATEAAEGIGPQASDPPPHKSIFESATPITTVDISFGPNAK